MYWSSEPTWPSVVVPEKWLPRLHCKSNVWPMMCCQIHYWTYHVILSNNKECHKNNYKLFLFRFSYIPFIISTTFTLDAPIFTAMTYGNCVDVVTRTIQVFWQCLIRVGVMVFNATFNNISVISWWSVLSPEWDSNSQRKP